MYFVLKNKRKEKTIDVYQTSQVIERLIQVAILDDYGELWESGKMIAHCGITGNQIVLTDCVTGQISFI